MTEELGRRRLRGRLGLRVSISESPAPSLPISAFASLTGGAGAVSRPRPINCCRAVGGSPATPLSPALPGPARMAKMVSRFRREPRNWNLLGSEHHFVGLESVGFRKVALKRLDILDSAWRFRRDSSRNMKGLKPGAANTPHRRRVSCSMGTSVRPSSPSARPRGRAVPAVTGITPPPPPCPCPRRLPAS